jgi:hypothetical protein
MDNGELKMDNDREAVRLTLLIFHCPLSIFHSPKGRGVFDTIGGTHPKMRGGGIAENA